MRKCGFIIQVPQFITSVSDNTSVIVLRKQGLFSIFKFYIYFCIQMEGDKKEAGQIKMLSVFTDNKNNNSSEKAAVYKIYF